MGKQINYYCDFDTFLKIAEAALNEGCLILKNKHTSQQQIPQNSLSAVTEDCACYYFYLPELAQLEQAQDVDGNYYVKTSANLSALSLIEAGFSQKFDESNRHGAYVGRARIYIPTDVYCANGERILRSERLTKTYEILARIVRRLCPSVEISHNDDISTAKPYKAYISPTCLTWREQGFELFDLLVPKKRQKLQLRD